MIDAGIEPGDLVVVEKKRTANDGDIVVALGNDTDSSLKRLIKKNNMYVLHGDGKNDYYMLKQADKGYLYIGK